MFSSRTVETLESRLVKPLDGSERKVPPRSWRQERSHLREPRFRRQALEGGRRAAQQHGRGRVQARRPRADLPQVHLGYLRRATRPAGSGTRSGRRPGRPGRVPGRQYFLGAQRGPLGVPAGKREAAHHRQDGGRRHAGRGARQPLAQGRAAQGLRPPAARQAAPRPAHRHDRQHRPGRQGQPLEGHPGPRLRVLPLPVRQRRGQEGRPVLHAAVHRAAPGRNADAVQGPRLRPVLRLRRYVRAVGEVRGSPRRPGGRHLRLRAGIEPYHLEARGG